MGVAGIPARQAHARARLDPQLIGELARDLGPDGLWRGRRRLLRLLRRTSSVPRSLGHGQASSMRIDVIDTGLFGRSWPPRGAVAIASTTDSPAVSLPKIV